MLARYVREKKLLSLEEAIANMTGRSAARLGMPESGTIAAGKFADVMILDPRTVEDRGTAEKPGVHPVGIRDVIVNGEFVMRDGAMTPRAPGGD